MFLKNIKCFAIWGVWHTHPLKYNIILDVIYSSSSEFPWNRIGYASHIWLSNSQVDSSWLRCFHCTFTWPMVRFRNEISLFLRIQSGLTRKYPLGSTCTSFQLITWVASCTYFFNTEIWKHCEPLSLVVKLTDILPVLFWIVFQKVRNIRVIT